MSHVISGQDLEVSKLPLITSGQGLVSPRPFPFSVT